LEFHAPIATQELQEVPSIGNATIVQLVTLDLLVNLIVYNVDQEAQLPKDTILYNGITGPLVWKLDALEIVEPMDGDS